MTRSIYVLLALALLLPGLAAAQAEEENAFKISRWNGGVVEADLRFGLDLVAGGTGPGTMGGVLSPTISGGAASLFTNPAELGRLRSQQLTVDTKLGLGTSTFGLDGNSLVSVDQIQEDTDQLLTDYDYGHREAPAYTDVSRVGGGQTGRISSFALAVPVHERLVLALGAQYPMDLEMDLRYNGMEVLLEAADEVGSQGLDLRTLLSFGMATNLRLAMNTMSFGAGSRLLEGSAGTLDVGLAVERFQVTNTMRLDATPSGLIVLGADRYYFNNAEDRSLRVGDTNALYWRARGRFAGSDWGFRLGLNYKPTFSDRLHLTLAYHHAPSFTLEDETAYSESYLPIFLNMDGSGDPAEGEEELFDLESFNLAKPTLTKRSVDTLGQSVELRLPSSLTFGSDVALGAHTLAVNYTLYHGEMSYGFTYNDAYRIGKKMSHGMRLGLDFKFPEKLKGSAWALVPVRLLFLDVDGLLMQALGRYTRYSDPHFRIGGGVVLGEGILEGMDNASLGDVLGAPMPTAFSLGRQYTLFDRVDVGVMVLGYPDVMMRFAFAYTM